MRRKLTQVELPLAKVPGTCHLMRDLHPLRTTPRSILARGLNPVPGIPINSSFLCLNMVRDASNKVTRYAISLKDTTSHQESFQGALELVFPQEMREKRG